MSADGIRRKNQGLTEAGSGFVNVQSGTGLPLWRLSDTEMFKTYRFYGKPWIAEIDWIDMVRECFPAVDPATGIFSKRDMAARARDLGYYSTEKGLFRAVTLAGSEMHLCLDGPLAATMPSSFDAGLERVYAANQERMRAGQGRGALLRWVKTDPSSMG